MKINKSKVGTVSVLIEAEMKFENDALDLIEMFGKLGVVDKFIEGIVMEANTEEFKIKNVKIMED